ncbi:hypothetical protein [Streptomyces mirabilis]|uniref:hypothetical protein n=1 Tax=Streptomyces mirabilis TaxID=68239 RepID=UPI0036DD45E7
MDTTHVAVDGWVDAIPAPGPRGTATFDLIVRPADADTADTDSHITERAVSDVASVSRFQLG